MAHDIYAGWSVVIRNARSGEILATTNFASSAHDYRHIEKTYGDEQVKRLAPDYMVEIYDVWPTGERGLAYSARGEGNAHRFLAGTHGVSLPDNPAAYASDMIEFRSGN